MFVGVGASRVRDLFNQAKAQAPAIVFVDEIDAVGRHRGAGLGGGHDEREQTLNQLLVEMDGFDTVEGRHPDRRHQPPRHPRPRPAAARPLRPPHRRRPARPRGAQGDPGRPRQGQADRSRASNLTLLARRTPGFTGADLANVLNEAALLAARRGAEIGDRARRRGRRRAGHGRAGEEGPGHVGAGEAGGRLPRGRPRPRGPRACPNGDPIHKVSIVSRGRALGWTLALPEEDRILHTRSELLDQLAMLLGGRCAEELVFGDPTTGAQNDIERATQIARSMVTQWGMSSALGPVQLGAPDGDAVRRARRPGRPGVLRDGRHPDRRRGDPARAVRLRGGRPSSCAGSGPRSTGWRRRWWSGRRSTSTSWPWSSPVSSLRSRFGDQRSTPA